KLLKSIDITKGLKPGGWILLNAPELPSNLGVFKGFKLAFVHAEQIALKHKLGTATRPIINTTMMGAFSRMMGIPSMEAIEEAIISEVPVKQTQNVEAAKEAYDNITIYGLVEETSD
ncbi:MAG: 2-oxoacid:acceptor oxidoreductase family protein, partial [SAR324 cluster bacterium]|nr:2-oxoacid:acceptor oxidoreductase family protein [SAR324 cluster bacterium]